MKKLLVGLAVIVAALGFTLVGPARHVQASCAVPSLTCPQYDDQGYDDAVPATPADDSGCDHFGWQVSKDCIVVKGSGTHVDSVEPEGFIPTFDPFEYGWYKVVYWKYGCCSGTHWLLVQSSYKYLDNDGNLHGRVFTNGGSGFDLRSGSSLCGGFYVDGGTWLLGSGNGACAGIR